MIRDIARSSARVGGQVVDPFEQLVDSLKMIFSHNKNALSSKELPQNKFAFDEAEQSFRKLVNNNARKINNYTNNELARGVIRAEVGVNDPPI